LSWIAYVVGEGALRLPGTDKRHHPIRLSLSTSLFSVARFRFAGHVQW